MENAANAPLFSHESPLYGDVNVATGTRFGYGWFGRTFGLGAIKVTWMSSGLQSIEVWARLSAKPKYCSFTATKNEHWFRLMDGEFLSEVDVGVAGDRVCSVRFKTNLRQSQWFGSKAETVRQVTPPSGFFIHAIHGRCHNGQCKNFGAYYVPMALRTAVPSGCTKVEASAAIGSATLDSNSGDCFSNRSVCVRAIVVSMALRPRRIQLLCNTQFLRHLAHLDGPLNDGDCQLILAENEILTGLRAWFGDDQSISSVQFVTNRRKTEWFGPVPPADATVEARCVEDVRRATLIGGIFGMVGEEGIKSVGVISTATPSKRASCVAQASW
jgi:hypothetical protein